MQNIKKDKNKNCNFNTIIALLIIVLFGLNVVSCSKSTSDKSDSSTQKKSEQDKSGNSKKKIALVMKTLTNPFFIEMEKGARKAESEFGIDLIVKTGAKETSIEQQISIIEELINSKVDAIVIAPGSSTDLMPVLKKAQDKNIKIVNVDNMLDREVSNSIGLKDVPFISVNNEEAAYESVKYISDKIKTPTEVAILEGIEGADNAENRKNGAMRAFNENPNIKIVASETANWKIDEAESVTRDIFAKHPDIGAMFCANDMMALGAMHYLDTTNKNVLIAGFDDLDEVQKAIENGNMQATINQQADIQGYTGIKYAVEMLNGKSEPLSTMIDVKVVSLDNMN